MKTEIATSLILTAILMTASALGLIEALGAHPFWAMQTEEIGCVAGLMCYAGSRWAGMRPGGQEIALGPQPTASICLGRICMKAPADRPKPSIGQELIDEKAQQHRGDQKPRDE